MGPPFPITSNTKSHKSMDKSTLKRETGGGRRRGGGLEKQKVHEQITKAAINLTQVKGYLYPRDRSDRYAGPGRPVCWTGQTGWLDRSDRCQGPVRRLACSTPCTTISSDGRGSFFKTKSSPRCRRLDEDPVRGFGGSAKPGQVAGFEKTAKTPRAGSFPPPCRGPRRRSCLGILM